MSADVSTARLRGTDAGMANEYRPVLKPEHYLVLDELHGTKRIVSNPTVQELLENLSLLEYHNDDDWCDAHPAVLPLLTEGGARA